MICDKKAIFNDSGIPSQQDRQSRDEGRIFEYRDPPNRPYQKNPSIAGSAQLCFKVDDIEETRARLEAAGVEFHAPIHRFWRVAGLSGMVLFPGPGRHYFGVGGTKTRLGLNPRE